MEETGGLHGPGILPPYEIHPTHSRRPRVPSSSSESGDVDETLFVRFLA